MTARTYTVTYTPRRVYKVGKGQKWLNGGTKYYFGAWRSPVAHLLWEQGVAGSNPAAPIGDPGAASAASGSCMFQRPDR